ncbi:Rpn family recombination-promoting nuclease/putative transposase [Hyalangium versicolor]|uniref:Rpn family recombination-promoting nuclease/putative transposase n=1 Tax=Hyalangium versicolor TaxID=2861190 RepID=UPI001CCC2914|nr:Rpn family recombination-promoting nuclease/putative transposase [Hyalangium versicolor]
MSGPHDRLVRFTFDQPERAAAELRAALPATVVQQVDWASLKLESGSVVDPELRETESDLLFSARLREGRKVLFYVLLEHQSTVNRWMALRMLRYVVRQLEHWRREHPGSKRLPVIIPLVMYHGPEGAWSAPRRVEELFDVPGEQSEQWLALVPRFEYLLDDLTTQREEELRARPGPSLVRLVLLALVYGRSEELALRLPGWRVLFLDALGEQQGMEDLKAVFHYLLLVGNEDARDATVDMLKSVAGAQQMEELMSTWLKEKFEKLEQSARAEGLAAGRAQDVLRILAVRGLPVDDIARQRISNCRDLALLDRWLERAVKASSVSEVLAELT